MEGEKGTVCVTGGTGFLASWLIKRLLQEGYSVHTTVRANPENNRRDMSFLTNLPGAAEKLKIFSADLRAPDSFDEAIEGCMGVFHVATAVDFETKESEEVGNQRAISGALGILKACLKSKTVKRVVYTSAASAVVFNNNNDVEMMDESSWTDVDFVRETWKQYGSYMISKTLTEKAALEFAAEHGLDLVSVIPSFIVGPFICPKFPDSVRMALALVSGDEYSHLLNTSMVHVDDLARAHIFLLEYSNAKGRYNCSLDPISLQKMAEILSAKHPEFPIPTSDSLADVKGMKIPGLSSKKLLDAGFKFMYGVEETFDGAIKCCREKGYL